MKTISVKALAAVSFLLSVSFSTITAQDYLINIKGDTLRGTLKILSYGAEKKVTVVGADKNKVTVPLFQIKSYFHKGDQYVPAKGPNGYAFMKVLKSGYLSLLAFQMENQASYDGRFLLKKDGSGVEVPNLTFKKTLKNFLGDCQGLDGRIEAGEFSRNELDKIINIYNECITGKQAEIEKVIAVKKEQAVKLNAWDALEAKIQKTPDLKDKDDALEMIKDIKGKIARSEKVPNFLIEGLKNTLNLPELQPELEAALKEIK